MKMKKKKKRKAAEIRKIAYTISEAKETVRAWRKDGRGIGFVPTMGFLHEGHLSLIERAARENDKTAVSIFVNPAQFAPSEDFDGYPRDFRADADLCEKMGVDLLFCPDAKEMYPDGFVSFIDMDGLTRELCGKSRPTHFRGVCTVVNKLFNIILPDRAYFGQKDAQQCAVISKMVDDLNMNTEIVCCPTVRESDGLAKSSRNIRLNPAERAAATVLNRSVREGERLIASGERDAGRVRAAMRAIVEAEPSARIDYIEIVDGKSIEKIDVVRGPVLGAVAVFIGKIRLIDNFIREV
jgi:pantoate--beta-alanine ligase